MHPAFFRFGRCWWDGRVGFSVWLFGAIFRNDLAAGFSSGLAAAPGFSVLLTGAASSADLCRGRLLVRPAFSLRSLLAGWPRRFSFWLLELSSGMTFAAGFSSGLAAAPGFSALLTGAVSLPPILPGVFAGVAGFFASAGAGGDLTDASGLFHITCRNSVLTAVFAGRICFLTSAGGGVPDLSSGFLGFSRRSGLLCRRFYPAVSLFWAVRLAALQRQVSFPALAVC